MYSAATRSPADRYQEMDLASRVEGATPHGLVTILYAELGMALDVLDRALAANDMRRVLSQHQRAASIVHALLSGLDLDGGGALAQSLTGIYRQMQRRLNDLRGGDPNALRELREGVANLAEAWSRIG